MISSKPQAHNSAAAMNSLMAIKTMEPGSNNPMANFRRTSAKNMVINMYRMDTTMHGTNPILIVDRPSGGNTDSLRGGTDTLLKITGLIIREIHRSPEVCDHLATCQEMWLNIWVILI